MKNKKILIIALIVLSAVIFVAVKTKYIDLMKLEDFYANPVRYKDIVEKYAKEYNVDENLVYAVIKNESKFYPFAKSRTNSKGLMQISDITYEHAKSSIDIKVDDIYNKETNIQVGVWYLSMMLARFKNEKYAILAYNAGPENISSWIKRGFMDEEKEYKYWNIPFIESRVYIDKVMKSKSIYTKRKK